jgi:uncharacterized protein (DUF433 family)
MIRCIERHHRQLVRSAAKVSSMTTQSLETPIVHPTEHPYIVRVPGVCGGRPIIKGTRISVRHIAQLYKAGDLVDEMLQAHPHLSAAAVYDAISYYLDHQVEIEQEIAENRVEALAAKHGFTLDERGFIRFARETPAS